MGHMKKKKCSLRTNDLPVPGGPVKRQFASARMIAGSILSCLAIVIVDSSSPRSFQT